MGIQHSRNLRLCSSVKIPQVLNFARKIESGYKSGNSPVGSAIIYLYNDGLDFAVQKG